MFAYHIQDDVRIDLLCVLSLPRQLKKTESSLSHSKALIYSVSPHIPSTISQLDSIIHIDIFFIFQNGHVKITFHGAFFNFELQKILLEQTIKTANTLVFPIKSNSS